MAVLEIALPGGAAGGFEERFARSAELAKVGITRNDNLFLLRQLLARTDAYHLPDQLSIGVRFGGRLFRIEAAVFEKLRGRARHDETVVGVIRFRLARIAGPFAVFVETVFPDQLVRVSKRVPFERETA